MEALGARATGDSHRHLDRMAVLESCDDGRSAIQVYRRLHQEFPHRELYFVHTSREELEIEERRWLGIRGIHLNEADTAA